MSLKDTVRKGLTILWLNLKFSVVLYLWKWFSRPMAYLSTICEMRSLRGSCSGRYVSHPWDKIPGMTFPLKPMLDYGEWSEHGSKGGLDLDPEYLVGILEGKIPWILDPSLKLWPSRVAYSHANPYSVFTNSFKIPFKCFWQFTARDVCLGI